MEHEIKLQLKSTPRIFTSKPTCLLCGS